MSTTNQLIRDDMLHVRMSQEAEERQARNLAQSCGHTDEHREAIRLLMQAVSVMRITQRLFDLSDGHILMSKCKEIERWLEAHQ